MHQKCIAKCEQVWEIALEVKKSRRNFSVDHSFKVEKLLREIMGRGNKATAIPRNPRIVENLLS